MSGFFSKIFGGKKKSEGGGAIEELVESTLNGIIEKGGFDLSFDLSSEVDEAGESVLTIELSGDDADLVKDKEGQMIDAIQLFIQRAIQHNFPEDKSKIVIDCGGYLEETNQALVELAEKLKGIALEKGKSVYFRALPPKDRKVIHQYLAGDERVKSRSIGDGLYKKIKIYPVKSGGGNEASTAD
jgi:spoIIIJ-associated protein